MEGTESEGFGNGVRKNTELVPYMYHYVVTAHEGGRVLMQPLEGKYHYMFGESLLVAPIYQDRLENEVKLPEGKWRYWFDDRQVIEGPITFEQEFSLEEYPVYIKEGAIVPMHIKRAYTGIGKPEDEGYLTFLIYPDLEESNFEVFREKDKSTVLTYKNLGKNLTVEISGKQIPHILNIKSPNQPSKITLDGKHLIEETDYKYLTEIKKLRIKTSAYSNGQYLIQF